MNNALSPIFMLSAIITLVLGISVIRVDRRNIIYVSWLFFCLSIAAWSLGLGVLSITTNTNVAYLFYLIHHIGAILIPTTFTYFVRVYFVKDSSFHYTIKCGLLLSVLQGVLFLSGQLVTPLTPKWEFTYYTNPGNFYPIFVIYSFSYILYSFFLMFKYTYQGGSKERKQKIFFIIATGMGYLGGSSIFLLVYDLKVPPYGVILFFLFPLITTYAIVKHDLLNVKFAARRVTVFAGLFTISYMFFAALTFLGQKYVSVVFGRNIWVSMATMLLLIIYALRPLDRILTELTEKYLFQRKYDYKELIKMFTTEVLSILELEQLAIKTVEGLNNIIKLESCAMVVLDEESDVYRIKYGFGLKNQNAEFKDDNPVIFYMRMTRSYLVRKSDNQKIYYSESLNKDFDTLNAELCLPIIFRDSLLGFISLGMKKSGDYFDKEDIDVLMALATTEAITVSNAGLYSELSQTQAEAAQKEKMAVIGTLAAGINHEICNPLGIARGQCEMFLLNYRDGIYKDKADKELVEKGVEIFGKVINEIDRATGITKRLSAFSKPATNFTPGIVNVADQVKEVFAILGHEMKVGNINYEINIPDNLPKIYGDRRQIQEVLFNLIRNAAQAISRDGLIKVSAEKKDNSIWVEVSDSGSGISSERMKQIFNPFYTTKDPGKGTGLGLFIVKQIVERNKGKIFVDNAAEGGAKFVMVFEIASESNDETADN